MAVQDSADIKPYYLNRGPLVIELGARKFREGGVTPDSQAARQIEAMSALPEAELDAKAEEVLSPTYMLRDFRALLLSILGAVYQSRGNVAMCQRISDVASADHRRFKQFRSMVFGCKPQMGGIVSRS